MRGSACGSFNGTLFGRAAAAEFRPVAVRTDAECFTNPPGKYAAGKMIDGDLGPCACPFQIKNTSIPSASS